MNTNVWLSLTIVFTALWSGLLLTVTTILHPMFASQDATGLRHDLGRFLPIARRSPTNYILVVGLIVTPVMAIASLWEARYDSTFLLVSLGFILTFVGAFVLSRFAAEPNYDVVLDGSLPSESARWGNARQKYFVLNWARGVLVWSALVCFVVAGYFFWG